MKYLIILLVLIGCSEPDGDWFCQYGRDDFAAGTYIHNKQELAVWLETHCYDPDEALEQIRKHVEELGGDWEELKHLYPRDNFEQDFCGCEQL